MYYSTNDILKSKSYDSNAHIYQYKLLIKWISIHCCIFLLFYLIDKPASRNTNLTRAVMLQPTRTKFLRYLIIIFWFKKQLKANIKLSIFIKDLLQLNSRILSIWSNVINSAFVYLLFSRMYQTTSVLIFVNLVNKLSISSLPYPPGYPIMIIKKGLGGYSLSFSNCASVPKFFCGKSSNCR